MPFDAFDVYMLASRLGLPDLAQVARVAGVMSVLQLTAYYAERRLRHSVARVIEDQMGAIELRIAYEGLSLDYPLRLPVAPARMEKLNAALLSVKFGTLGDQSSLTNDERSLWLIQRASGTHLHGILIAPDRPEPPYSTIVNAIDAYLPEAIREVPLRSRP